MKTVKQIYDEFSLLKTDTEKWKYIFDNKNEENIPPVMLDNDCTDIGIYYIEDGQEKGKNFYFETCIGNNKGVFVMLKSFGIKALGV